MSKEVTRIIEQPDDLMPALQWAWDMAGRGLAGGPVRLALGRPERKRSSQANRLMWALLRDVATQVEWAGEYLSESDWKDLISASMRGQRLVPAIDGGLVALGARTSEMSSREFADLIDCIYSVGNERGVQWSDGSAQQWDEWRAAA